MAVLPYLTLDTPNTESKPKQASAPSPRGGTRDYAVFICSFCCIVLCSFVAYVFVKPAWNAHGWPSYYGYGKNTESAALALSIVAIILIGAAARKIRRFHAVCLLVPTLLLLRVYYVNWRAILILAVITVGFGIVYSWLTTNPPSDQESDAQPASRKNVAAHVAVIVFLLVWFFVAGLTPIPTVDLHHDGEVVTAGLDLLAKGVPFRTLYYAHGMSDAGVVALIMAATGNKGLGALAMMVAISTAIGAVTLYALAFGITRKIWLSFVIAFIGSTLIGQRVTDLESIPFAILAILWLSRGIGPGSLIGAGVLLGAGMIWRIDSGVFGIGVALLYIAVDAFKPLLWPSAPEQPDGGSAVARCVGDLIGNVSVFALSLVAVLAASRLAFGFPTREWYQVTLVDFPKYHRDSTGTAMPVAWNFGPTWKPTALRLYGTPIAVLVFVASFAFAARMVFERRVKLDTTPTRFFWLTMAYGLLGIKTMFDRSDSIHLIEGTLVLTLLFTIYAINQAITSRGTSATAPALICAAVLIGATVLLRVAAYEWKGYGSPGVVGLYGIYPRTDFMSTLRTCTTPTSTAATLLAPNTSRTAATVLAGVDQTRAILDANHIGNQELLVYHSAALLYPLLGRTVPTKYYCLGWAADTRLERDLVSELERRHIRAYLHVVHNYGGLGRYDVPDAHRIPIVHQYIEARESTGRRFDTPIGTLTILGPDPAQQHTP